MVEDLGYMLQLPTSLFQRRVVKYDAGVLTLCFDAILSKKALKAKDCIIEQTAPVHCLTDHHTVITVLASFEKMIEVLLVYGVYCLAVNAKKTKGKD